MHEVLVNRLGGLSLLRKSVVRLTDRPDMTLDVYRGRKTTNQQINMTFDPYCGLDLSCGNLIILVRDTPSHYAFFSVKFHQICFSRFKVMAEILVVMDKRIVGLTDGAILICLLSPFGV